MIVTVDRGPDENPRYENTISCAIEYFVEKDLDAFFLATVDAPGQNAFNRVQCKMVKLSKELSGVIHQHDRFWSHLDGKGETIDKDLELRNFQYAGHILADIWSEL